jgi:hypothetical protein
MLTTRQRLRAASLAGCLLLAACGDSARQSASANAANAFDRETAPELPIPTPQPPLSREQLLVAALRAASDFAAGTDDSHRQNELANRSFEFRIRFGCDGPTNGAEPRFGWSFNESTRALKVRATPLLSAEDAPVAAIAADDVEAVEGFWVDRPWLLTAACPRAPQPPTNAGEQATDETVPRAPESAVERTVGIAQFFTAADPRSMRRSGRSYEATRRLEEGDGPAGGFELVISGELKPLPGGKVIACAPSSGGGRPACVISVEFGRVSIERADTHEQLAQWGAG